MNRKFTESFDNLKAVLGNVGGQWDDTQPNKKVLRKKGGVFTWFESTGTLLFQGRPGEKEKLEKEILEILYPEEAKKLPDPITVQPPEAGGCPQAVMSDGSIESNYLLGEVSESEIVIGIVSAVGTESKRVIDPLIDRLRNFGYAAEEIKVSSILSKFAGQNDEYARIRHYMEAGDALRLKSGNNAILATGAAKLIKERRSQSSMGAKKAYIVNSLKHPDEVAFLRKIYAEGFYLFGIHADEKRRHKYLTNDKGCKAAAADELIQIDEDESVPHGQKTRDTYHLSDLFLNLGKNDDHVKETIQRFLELIFSHPYKNPTFDEFAMFMAFNSSVRSSDLSRQVGSVITRDHQIIATGANDVPQSGGGLYWAKVNPETGIVEDHVDGKDYTREQDSNKNAQNEMIGEIVGSAISEGLIEEGDRDKFKALLKGSKISDLTEFGRVVHAEMEALLSCGRAGVPTLNAILYCTTFPCHNCAKHIIDAGIKRVVYVEPYPKSRALEFHSESVFLKTQLDEKHDPNLVVFEPFIGVGPRRFLDLFSMNLGSGSKLRRKSSQGSTVEWDAKTAAMRTPLLPKSYREIESAAASIWDASTK